MNFSDIVQGESGFLVELRCNNVFHEQLFEKIKNYLNEKETEWKEEFPKVKDTIPKSTLTLLPEHAVVRLLGIECQFLVTS